MKNSFYSEENQFLGYVLKKYYNYGMHYKQYLEKSRLHFDSYIAIEFKKNSTDSVDWKYWLYNYRYMGNRSFMPCFNYLKLQVKENVVSRDDSAFSKFLEKIPYPETLCPYIVKEKRIIWDCSDEVIQWVYKNRSDDKVTEDDIKKEFERMKNDLGKYVKKINDEVEKKQLENDKSKKNTKPKVASKLKKKVEMTTESKATSKTQKQGYKKTDSDKKSGKAQKAKAKKS